MNKSGKQEEEREEEREEEERKEERKGVPHFSAKLREVGTSAAHEERVRGQDTRTVVIATALSS
jgi:hypothetical protein